MVKSDMSVVFPPSLPSHSEHSDAQLWYICCFPTGLLAKGRHTPSCRFQVGLRFFLCQIFCSNFWVDRSFNQALRRYL